jgi:Fe-S-cluster-containing hydrogenase component 2/thioredoxin reductase/CRP-like cAMP-binding protein
MSVAAPAGVYQLAIIGAGPAGLSCAARAAQIDRRNKRPTPSYVLLEGFSLPAKTIQRYQKGKKVMAEPGYLDLRSDMRFAEGIREGILGGWSEDLSRLEVNIRYGAEVKKISGQAGDFTIRLANGEQLRAAAVVLGIGVQGNPRKLNVAGEDERTVLYQLDDPKEFRNEKIIVVGAGDAAIENALALSELNDVVIVNRNNEFSRAKDGNLNAVLKAISDPQQRLSCSYESTTRKIEPHPDGTAPLLVTMETKGGVKTFAAHRIIARLGADPPRPFVEAMGIQFPGPEANALPVLSRRYESNVAGIYVVGALAGVELIKQAMNQGYDVAEFIYGNDIKPADYPLLTTKFSGLPFEREVDELLDRFKSIVPMFREFNALAFRELIIQSAMVVAYPPGAEHRDASAKAASQFAALKLKDPKIRDDDPRISRIVQEGEALYKPGEFGTSFFTIVAGEVTLRSDDPTPVTSKLQRGEFFGETSLLSGRPRAETAIAGPGCVLVETPRRTMIKLMSSNAVVRAGIDWVFVVRELKSQFAPFAPLKDLREIAERVSIRKFKAGDLIFKEGSPANSLFIVRSGAVTLTRQRDGQDLLVAQISSGQLLGEMALMGDRIRRETAHATLALELIEVRREEFLALTQRRDAQIEPLQRAANDRITDNARMEVRPESGSLMNFLMAQGLGEATDVLVIDETLCIGCDNCERGCAETHGGVSRLDRRHGPSYAQIHIAVACRHCEQPHCMKDCPPNAIKRSPTGEVYIDDTCIGCGNCQTNCPYHVIRMEYEAPKKPGLLQWLLFGAGPGVGEEPDYHPSEKAKGKGKKAMKCDACLSVPTGPACVKACPTGAAMRIGPDKFIDLVEESRG